MRHITKEILKDCSTSELFCFSLNCAQCGMQWKSTAVPFSKAGVIPQTEGKRIIFETLYRKEKETAICKAVEEAANVFNQCPICGHLVCDRCFLLCTDLDLCASCADRLHEQGEPVMQYA